MNDNESPASDHDKNPASGESDPLHIETMEDLDADEDQIPRVGRAHMKPASGLSDPLHIEAVEDLDADQEESTRKAGGAYKG